MERLTSSIFVRMSLRDYFAAKAMLNFAIPQMYGVITETTTEGDQLVAKRCYELADAMILEREKK